MTNDNHSFKIFRTGLDLNNRPADWRKGQYVFNWVNARFPEVANHFRGTQYDCFYDDSLINDFLNQCELYAETLTDQE